MSLEFLTRSDTNLAVQPEKITGGLNFEILEVVRLNYLCSKNKRADQLCGHCAADLHICFCICKKQVFSGRGERRTLDCKVAGIVSLSKTLHPHCLVLVKPRKPSQND